MLKRLQDPPVSERFEEKINSYIPINQGHHLQPPPLLQNPYCPKKQTQSCELKYHTEQKIWF